MIRAGCRNLVLSALVLGALAACTSSDPRESGAPSPSSSAPSSQAPRQNLVVVVERRGDRLELFSVGQDRRAVLLRRLLVPNGTRFINDVTLSRDADPRVCALFFGPEGGDTPGPSALGCYERGETTPVVLWGTTDEASSAEPYLTYSAALRPDGAALAWLDGEYWDQFDVVTADWDGRTTSHAEHYVTDPARPSGEGGPTSPLAHRVTAVTWCGDNSLLLDTHLDGGSSELHLLRLGADARRRGWLPSAIEVVPPDRQTSYYAASTCLADGSALALADTTRQGTAVPSRAVRLEPSSGRVMEVVSVPATGRDLVSASGGGSGVVYGTYRVSPSGEVVDRRFYVRFPGERHGKPITGLPVDTSDVVAQP